VSTTIKEGLLRLASEQRQYEQAARNLMQARLSFDRAYDDLIKAQKEEAPTIAGACANGCSCGFPIDMDTE
jgi:hypothetical protein